MSTKKIRLTLELSDDQRQDILTYIQGKGWNIKDIVKCDEEIYSQDDSCKYLYPYVHLALKHDINVKSIDDLF